jgi:hypothetical protein
VKKSIINIIDRARAHYVWAKDIGESSANSLTNCMVHGLSPKRKWRQGVLNLELQSKALLLKNLHKLYSKDNTPWI